MNLTPRDVWRFARKVKVRGPDDCWEWQGGLRKGYGRLYLKRERRKVSVYAHRVAYFIHNGHLPDDLLVCHSCDNRRCCNPRHLWLGTTIDNMRDASRKGRLKGVSMPGTSNHQAKLNDKAVRDIRTSTLPCKALAARYGVSDMIVSLVKRRKRWAHVSDHPTNQGA